MARVPNIRWDTSGSLAAIRARMEAGRVAAQGIESSGRAIGGGLAMLGRGAGEGIHRGKMRKERASARADAKAERAADRAQSQANADRSFGLQQARMSLDVIRADMGIQAEQLRGVTEEISNAQARAIANPSLAQSEEYQENLSALMGRQDVLEAGIRAGPDRMRQTLAGFTTTPSGGYVRTQPEGKT